MIVDKNDAANCLRRNILVWPYNVSL